MFIDSHAHLTFGDDIAQIHEIIKRARDAQVDHIINICTDEPTLQRGLQLSRQYPWIFNTGATTPHDVKEEGEKNFPLFEKAAKEGRLVAVGETGLDYYYEHSDRELQKYFLKQYLQLAVSCNLPVIFHCREAFADLFSVCDSHYAKEGKAILHCFTGTLEEAQEVLKRGWYLSFSGIVTFKKSQALREVVRQVPLEQMLIETDSPYLAPQSKRGKPNEPGYISETAEMIAKIKQKDLQEVAAITSENAKNVFMLPKNSG
ncbi:MAG: TatD family hydrolase [Simkaniaceae bacterium]